MSDNFIKNDNFGLNVKFPTRTAQQIKESANGLVGGLWDPLFSFIDENQNVFKGNVADEIERYNLMMINVGAALRERTLGTSLNLNG